MGALHEGHLELVRKACRQNQEVIVSIFVNPTQFNDPEDLKKYPKTLEKDLAKLRTISCEIKVFAPGVNEMYGSEILARTYDFDGMDSLMEGAHRPGHFDGVGTIVESLLQLVQPNRAYFGEKDYQQLVIIRHLAKKQGIRSEIVPCPIVREKNGLAMSSRNKLLTKSLQKQAGLIYQTLVKAKNLFGTKSASEVKDFVREAFSEYPDFELEYVEIADAYSLEPVMRKENDKKYRVFVAAYLGGVRLIDNIALN
jgi:pantoate--beta-alanine ligase